MEDTLIARAAFFNMIANRVVGRRGQVPRRVEFSDDANHTTADDVQEQTVDYRALELLRAALDVDPKDRVALMAFSAALANYRDDSALSDHFLHIDSLEEAGYVLETCIQRRAAYFLKYAVRKDRLDEEPEMRSVRIRRVLRFCNHYRECLKIG